MNRVKPFLTTTDMVLIALFSVLIAICAWISIPATVPFTLQTFAVLCTLGLLGGKRGTVAILLYLLMGAVGLPVFSNFGGGLGKLLGVTGGYLIGFLAASLLYWLLTKLAGDRYPARLTGMILGLVVCYAFGTAWFMVAYAPASGPVSLATAQIGRAHV
jgi:biotin transport system substrate-specific component